MASLSAECSRWMKPWTVAAVIVATVLYVLACNNEFYALTSPPSLSWHVLLRKSYSVVAFACVGYLARRALLEHGRSNVVLACVAGVAAYSALIEVGQYLLGSNEGLGWNLFDTLCGALGGAVAIGDRLLRRRRLT